MSTVLIPGGTYRGSISRITAIEFEEDTPTIHLAWRSASTETDEVFVPHLAQADITLVCRIPAGAPFIWKNPLTNTQKQEIIDALDGTPASVNGFNAIMRDSRVVADVTRVSDTEVYIDFEKSGSGLVLDQTVETVDLAENTSWVETPGGGLVSEIVAGETVDIVDAPFWRQAEIINTNITGFSARTSIVYPLDFNEPNQDGPPPDGDLNPPFEIFLRCITRTTSSGFYTITEQQADDVGGIDNILQGVWASGAAGPVINMAEFPNWSGDLGQGPPWVGEPRYQPLRRVRHQYVQGYPTASLFDGKWLLSWTMWYFPDNSLDFFPGSNGSWSTACRIYPRGWRG